MLCVLGETVYSSTYFPPEFYLLKQSKLYNKGILKHLNEKNYFGLDSKTAHASGRHFLGLLNEESQIYQCSTALDIPLRLLLASFCNSFVLHMHIQLPAQLR